MIYRTEHNLVDTLVARRL